MEFILIKPNKDNFSSHEIYQQLIKLKSFLIYRNFEVYELKKLNKIIGYIIKYNEKFIKNLNELTKEINCLIFSFFDDLQSIDGDIRKINKPDTINGKWILSLINKKHWMEIQ